MAGPRFRDETELQRPRAEGDGLRLDHIKLTWTDARGAVRQQQVKDRLVLGSAPTAELAIDDAAVSRLHAEIERVGDAVWVRDLGSKNGTFVQGVRVREAVVPDRGLLRLGATDLWVHYIYADGPVEGLWPEPSFGHLVGGSRPMRALYALLAKVAETESSVLIRGETGTGKEWVARTLHDASHVKSGPFVTVDCAALPESLLDAELFGHAKGAFTGALGARAGAFEAADGGTIFLDEVGELPLAVQPKLLRVLESRTIRRLGETQHRPVRVRVIAATHRNLLEMVNAGEFREDLYFRLAVVPVYVAPLRERVADLDVLVRKFLGAHPDAGRPDMLALLRDRPWRGNVRELRNFVERWRALGFQAALAVDDPQAAPPAPSPAPPSPGPAAREGAPRPVRDAVQDEAEVAASTDDTSSGPGAEPLDLDVPLRVFRDAWVDQGDRRYIERLLKRFDGKVAEAAKAAEVDRTYLYKLIRRYFR